MPRTRGVPTFFPLLRTQLTTASKGPAASTVPTTMVSIAVSSGVRSREYPRPVGVCVLDPAGMVTRWHTMSIAPPLAEACSVCWSTYRPAGRVTRSSSVYSTTAGTAVPSLGKLATSTAVPWAPTGAGEASTPHSCGFAAGALPLLGALAR